LPAGDNPLTIVDSRRNDRKVVDHRTNFDRALLDPVVGFDNPGK
jgi:hypothetical protein